jgi:hypothetical protein
MRKAMILSISLSSLKTMNYPHAIKKKRTTEVAGWEERDVSKTQGSGSKKRQKKRIG